MILVLSHQMDTSNKLTFLFVQPHLPDRERHKKPISKKEKEQKNSVRKFPANVSWHLKKKKNPATQPNTQPRSSVQLRLPSSKMQILFLILFF